MATKVAYSTTRPKHFLGLTITQVVFGAFSLGLAAFEQYGYDSRLGATVSIVSGTIGFALFTIIFSLITNTYLLVAVDRRPAIYHRLVATGLIAANVAFWLITWVLYLRIVVLIGERPRPAGTYRYDNSDALARDPSSFFSYVASLCMAFIVWICYLFLLMPVYRSRQDSTAPVQAISGGSAERGEVQEVKP